MVQARRIACQSARKTTAPMMAVINSPQKSGTTRTPSLEKRNPPNSEPIRPTIRLRSSPRGALVILAASQPAIRPIRIQANTPIVNLLVILLVKSPGSGSSTGGLPSRAHRQVALQVVAQAASHVQ